LGQPRGIGATTGNWGNHGGIAPTKVQLI